MYTYVYMYNTCICIWSMCLLSELQFAWYYIQCFVSCSYFHCYAATSDLRSAQVVFFENNIYLSCVLARNSPALGCSIRLTLATNTNDSQPDAIFDLLRNEMPSNTDDIILSNCTMSTNRKAAYDEERTVGVAIREDDVPVSVTVPVALSEEGSADNFTRITNCTLPQQGQNM